MTALQVVPDEVGEQPRIIREHRASIDAVLTDATVRVYGDVDSKDGEHRAVISITGASLYVRLTAVSLETLRQLEDVIPRVRAELERRRERL